MGAGACCHGLSVCIPSSSSEKDRGRPVMGAGGGKSAWEWPIKRIFYIIPTLADLVTAVCKIYGKIHYNF